MTAAGMAIADVTYVPSISYGEDLEPFNTIVGDPVTISISLDAANVDILQLPFLPAPGKLSTTATMSKEGSS